MIVYKQPVDRDIFYTFAINTPAADRKPWCRTSHTSAVRAISSIYGRWDDSGTSASTPSATIAMASVTEKLG